MASKSKAAISLVEVLIAFAILSLLILPVLMFLMEYSRGSSQLGDYYQVLNIVEEKLDTALAMKFAELPLGETSNTLIEAESGRHLDLRNIAIAKTTLTLRMQTENVNMSFSALNDAISAQVQRVELANGMKRIEIIAEWGDTKKHNIALVSYKADL